MATYEQQTFLDSDPSPSSVQGYRASQQASPGSDEAKTMTVGSGRQLSMLLNQSTPLGVFSKILMESSAWGNSEEFCYVWNHLDTKCGCSAFQLTPSGQSTGDKECSLWRTPNAAIVTGGGQDGEKRLAAGHAMQLSDQVKTPKLWPTPTVPNGGRRNPKGTSITGKKPNGGKAQIDFREFAIRMLSTPTARDWKSTSHAKTATNARPLSEVAGQTGSGSLNPRFVEELMGYPIDHTALKRSATPSVHSKRSPSSKQSHKQKG